MTGKEALKRLLQLPHRWIWYSAAALAVLLVGLGFWWLALHRRTDMEQPKWTRALSGAVRIEIAEGGQLEGPHDTTATPSGLADGNLQLKLSTYETVVSRLADCSGMPVEIAFGDFPAQSFSARLIKVFGRSDGGAEAQRWPFSAVFELGAQPPLQPGMSVGSVMLLDSLAQAIAVPESAVYEIADAPVIFPRSDWPRPRPVNLGPRSNGVIVVVDGLSAGEEVALTSPKDASEVSRLRWETYRKSADASREQLLAHLEDMIRRFAFGLKETEKVSEPLLAVPANTDSGSAIDALLLMQGGAPDTAANVSIQQIRIGPGEGGKLAPVSPEMQEQMKGGEKISVSVPASRDSSADSLRVPLDTSKTVTKPPAGP